MPLESESLLWTNCVSAFENENDIKPLLKVCQNKLACLPHLSPVQPKCIHAGIGQEFTYSMDMDYLG